MPFPCVGCSLSHVADAAQLVDEARKFERLGDRKMADLHLAKALGSLREGEEQAVKREHADQLRGIRKRIEGAIASGQPIPDVSGELNGKAAEMIDLLRHKPTLCPTCQLKRKPTVEHV